MIPHQDTKSYTFWKKPSEMMQTPIPSPSAASPLRAPLTLGVVACGSGSLAVPFQPTKPFSASRLRVPRTLAFRRTIGIALSVANRFSAGVLIFLDRNQNTVSCTKIYFAAK